MKKKKTTLAYRRLQEIRYLQQLLCWARGREVEQRNRLQAIAEKHADLKERFGFLVLRGISGNSSLVGREERPVQKFKDLEEARKWVMSNLVNP